MYDLHAVSYDDQIKIGKKEIRGRFVIPSGIRCTCASAIERYFSVDAIGIITTKSVSIKPKKGYKEPLYARYAENSYLNAVGLENPGARVVREELSHIRVPQNKFLLVSLFGGDEEEFLEAAGILAGCADGFELNMSCPHAKGYGLQIGSDPALVSRITESIARRFDLPVFVKLSATIPNVAQTAKTAVQSGAAGITVTNTVGPGVDFIAGAPVLSNVVGGLSGEAIRPLGLKALRDIREAIGAGPPVIGMGGIFNRAHVESYHAAGADFFGVGSALTDINTEEAVKYFAALEDDLIRRPPRDSYTLKPVDNMRYLPCVVQENTALTPALHKITVSRWSEENVDTAGKFFFLMLPGTGEKPFAVYSYAGGEFIVKNVGPFTHALTRLKPGDTLYVRGPYGKEIPAYSGAVINFVAGGAGLSPVYEMARKYAPANGIRFFLGGRTAGDIFDLDRFQALGEALVSTEDGGAGRKGFVSGLLEGFPFERDRRQIFFTVGPKMMIDACVARQRDLAAGEDIWVSIEYHTSCGVGICGKCANENGFLTCVDGPFLRVADAMKG